MLKQILKNIMVIVSLSFIALGLFSTANVNAQFSTTALPTSNNICGQNKERGRLIGCENSDLAQLAGNIAGVLTFIIVSIAIIFIVYGAFVWMTDLKEGATTGRKIITQAIIALIISVIAYGIVASLIAFLSTAKIA